MPQAKAVNFTMPVFPYDRWGGIEPLARSVKEAEDLGFWGVRLPEHIIMPVRPDAPSVSTVWYDNFVLGAHLATLTERIRIVFSVMVTPYRPPVQTAKLIATLDQVSKGRLIVGTGVGWMRGEFRVLGLTHAERGAVTDDYLAAMRELWTSDAPSYEGKYARFGSIAFEPKCYQQPHVPLWIGGSGPAAERRVAEFGDGWIPMVGELPGLADDVARIKAAVAARGRDAEALDCAYEVFFGEPDPLSLVARAHVTGKQAGERPAPGPEGTPEAVRELVHRYAEAGFTNLGVNFTWTSPDDHLRNLHAFANQVMARL